MRKPSRDYGAGERVQEMREDRGLSRDDLVLRARLDNPRDPRMHISYRTLQRVEEEGAIPTARVKFAIAAVFNMVPSEIWGSRVRVAA